MHIAFMPAVFKAAADAAAGLAPADPADAPSPIIMAPTPLFHVTANNCLLHPVTAIGGGEKIYCSEVEAAIYTHDSVAQVAVFGLPDDRLGEVVAAAIVVRDGATMTEADLLAHLDGALAKPKIPERVWFRTDPLPQNASGKFLKRQLRDELAIA